MNNNFKIRPAKKEDITAIFELIKALAEYEKLGNSFTGNQEILAKHLFENPIFAEAIVAEIDNNIVGFALFFNTYSTFLTKPGIHLEDLFVMPKYRQKGIGKAMIKYLANLAIERDCGRLEWTVLNWNENAINFYQQLGAEILPDWQICRLTGSSLLNLQ